MNRYRVVLASLGIAALCATATPAQTDAAAFGQATCTTIYRQLKANPRLGGDDDRVLLMHTAGCDYDETQRVWAHREGRYGGGCNRRAYDIARAYVDAGRNLAADDGELFGRIWQRVVKSGCRQFEDGTYGVR